MVWRGLRYEQLAGQKAAVAKLDELNHAREMHSQGMDEQEIWRETGWLLGRDNKWRFEIPDDLDKIDFTPLFKDEYHIARLKDIYDNPKLYEAYPALATLSVKIIDKLGDNTRGLLRVVKYPGGKVRVSGIELNQKFIEDTKRIMSKLLSARPRARRLGLSDGQKNAI